jgi:hypothetical protein
MPAGYSGTPLAQKLGYRTGSRVALRNAPAHYERLVAPLPQGVQLLTTRAKQLDLLHHFVTRRAELTMHLAADMRRIHPDGMLWISWPKRASKVETDVTEDVIRAAALELGLVDVKVCAVDETWSGLKLVIRKQLRS